MNREQMVERARDEISAWDNDCGCPISGDLAESIGASVLDAILPQVTTVAELEELPDGSLLVAPNGEPVRHLYAHWSTEREWLARYGVLTVVWQPEVTA